MPFVLFLLYVFLSYVYPGEIFPALAAYRVTFVVGLSGLVFSVLWLVSKRSTPLATRQLWFLAAFTLTLVASRMLAERWFGAVIPALTQFGPSVAMFVLTVCSVDSLRKLKTTAGCIVLLSVALVLQGVLAYHFGYKANMFLYDPATRAEYVASADASEDEAPAEDIGTPDNEDEGVGYTPDDEAGEYDGSTLKRIRGLGLLHDPNDLALGLVMALPLLWIGWREGKTMRNLLLVGLPSAALIYGLFLTRSRGGALALGIILCAALSRRIGRVAAIALLLVLTAGGLAADFASGRQLSISDESASGRLQAWTEGFEMLKSEPLLGVGYGQFLEHHTLTAHNSFVLCFAETGFIGYFFWIGLIVICVAELRGLQKLPGADPLTCEIRRWSKTLQLSLVGFLTAGFFLSRTFIPMLYLLFGLCVALVLIARQAQKPVRAISLPRLGSLVLASEFGSILFIYIAIKLYLA